MVFLLPHPVVYTKFTNMAAVMKTGCSEMSIRLSV